TGADCPRATGNAATSAAAVNNPFFQWFIAGSSETAGRSIGPGRARLIDLATRRIPRRVRAPGWGRERGPSTGAILASLEKSRRTTDGGLGTDRGGGGWRRGELPVSRRRRGVARGARRAAVGAGPHGPRALRGEPHDGIGRRDGTGGPPRLPRPRRDRRTARS